MNSFTLVCLFALVVASCARPSDKYTDRYDNVDLDEIIGNRRLLMPYIKCTLEQGRCSPEGKELKSHIGEALSNYCAKCTEVQKNGTRKVIGHIINNEPDYWNQLVSKYDPKRQYVKKYENELKSVARAG